MNSKKSLLVKIIIILSMLVLSFYLVNIVLKLDVLPNKFLAIFYAVVGVLNVLGALTLLIKKWWTKIFTVLTYLVLIVISVVGIKYGTDTLKFLDSSFSNNDVEITTYNVVTLKEYNYTLEDVNNKVLYYLNNDPQFKDVEKKLNDKVTVNYQAYEDLILLYEDLINKKVTFVLMDEAYLDILAESYKDLDEVIEVLYEIDIETKIEVNYDEVIELKPLSVYISGSDGGRGVIRNKSRSDVNIIATINPDTKTILLTSIPRDYYVDVYGKIGLKDKLTHAGIYGTEVSKKTIENLFETEITYTVKTGFSAVVEVVDLVGGVTIYSDRTFNSYHMKGWVVKKGDNEMDGAKALAYSRERYAYATGDRHRIKNQQQVLAAVIEKASQSPELLMKYDELLGSLSKFYVTNIPRGLITEVVKLQLDEMPKWNILSQTVSGSDASLPTYTAPNSKRYVMIPYEKDLVRAKENINAVLSGETTIREK